MSQARESKTRAQSCSQNTVLSQKEEKKYIDKNIILNYKGEEKKNFQAGPGFGV